MKRSLRRLVGLMVIGCFVSPSAWGLAKADSDQSPDETSSDAPRAVYPPFARPPGYDKDYDTWADASGPDVGERVVDSARLPSRVDNSSRPQFPPIYRQKWGACGQFTAAASMFTYEMNVADGETADTDERRFPAHFTWNMVNRAENKGSEAFHGWEVAKQIGIPTAKAYGGVRLDKIGVWPNGYNVWRDAMNYRVSGYRYTPAQTIEQVNEARGWMYDRNQPSEEGQAIGGLMALDGRMGDLPKVTVTIPQGKYAAGEDLWTRWGPTGYGHGITCVGYDDNVGHDLNKDGKITNDADINGDGKVTLADWERGAYIVVNSWGNKWSGDGKIYLLYSAMIDPTWERGNYLGRMEVKRHVPRMTLRLKLACDDRTDLRMTIGLAGDAEADQSEQTYKPEAFNGWPVFGKTHAGHVPMAGPEDDTPLEVGIDLTALLDRLGPDADGKGKVFLRLSRAKGSDAVGELLEAAVRTYDAQGKLIAEQPIEVSEGGFGGAVLRIESPISGLLTD